MKLRVLSFSLEDVGAFLEESWSESGWVPVEGTVKRILDGSIDCDEVTEVEASKIYPEAFMD